MIEWFRAALGLSMKDPGLGYGNEKRLKTVWLPCSCAVFGSACGSSRSYTTD